ncbi:hypothetical protein C0J52_22944 [Blattella germanica]|nr:hypothetical protein C0J52_22944 [Blattella germanica]
MEVIKFAGSGAERVFASDSAPPLDLERSITQLYHSVNKSSSPLLLLLQTSSRFPVVDIPRIQGVTF